MILDLSVSIHLVLLLLLNHVRVICHLLLLNHVRVVWHLLLLNHDRVINQRLTGLLIALNHVGLSIKSGRLSVVSGCNT